MTSDGDASDGSLRGSSEEVNTTEQLRSGSSEEVNTTEQLRSGSSEEVNTTEQLGSGSSEEVNTTEQLRSEEQQPVVAPTDGNSCEDEIHVLGAALIRSLSHDQVQLTGSDNSEDGRADSSKDADSSNGADSREDDVDDCGGKENSCNGADSSNGTDSSEGADSSNGADSREDDVDDGGGKDDQTGMNTNIDRRLPPVIQHSPADQTSGSEVTNFDGLAMTEAPKTSSSGIETAISEMSTDISLPYTESLETSSGPRRLSYYYDENRSPVLLTIHSPTPSQEDQNSLREVENLPRDSEAESETDISVGEVEESNVSLLSDETDSLSYLVGTEKSIVKVVIEAPSSSSNESLNHISTPPSSQSHAANFGESNEEVSTGTFSSYNAPSSTSATSDPIKTSPTSDPISTSATSDPIKTSATSDPITTSATSDPISTSATSDPITTSATSDPIKTSATSDPIKTSATSDPIKTSATYDPITTSATSDAIKTSATSDPIKSSATPDPIKTPLTPDAIKTSETPDPIKTSSNISNSVSVTTSISLSENGEDSLTSSTDSNSIPREYSPISEEKTNLTTDERSDSSLVTTSSEIGYYGFDIQQDTSCSYYGYEPLSTIYEDPSGSQIDSEIYEDPEVLKEGLVAAKSSNSIILEKALKILHCKSTENVISLCQDLEKTLDSSSDVKTTFSSGQSIYSIETDSEKEENLVIKAARMLLEAKTLEEQKHLYKYLLDVAGLDDDADSDTIIGSLLTLLSVSDLPSSTTDELTDILRFCRETIDGTRAYDETEEMLITGHSLIHSGRQDSKSESERADSLPQNSDISSQSSLYEEARNILKPLLESEFPNLAIRSSSSLPSSPVLSESNLSFIKNAKELAGFPPAVIEKLIRTGIKLTTARDLTESSHRKSSDHKSISSEGGELLNTNEKMKLRRAAVKARKTFKYSRSFIDAVKNRTSPDETPQYAYASKDKDDTDEDSEFEVLSLRDDEVITALNTSPQSINKYDSHEPNIPTSVDHNEAEEPSVGQEIEGKAVISNPTVDTDNSNTSQGSASRYSVRNTSSLFSSNLRSNSSQETKSLENPSQVTDKICISSPDMGSHFLYGRNLDHRNEMLVYSNVSKPFIDRIKRSNSKDRRDIRSSPNSNLSFYNVVSLSTMPNDIHHACSVTTCECCAKNESLITNLRKRQKELTEQFNKNLRFTLPALLEIAMFLLEVPQERERAIDNLEAMDTQYWKDPRDLKLFRKILLVLHFMNEELTSSRTRFLHAQVRFCESDIF